MRRFVRGNRFVLLQAIRYTLAPATQEKLAPVAECLRRSIDYWRRLSRRFASLHQGGTIEPESLADAVRGAAIVERDLVTTIQRSLAVM